MSELPEDPFKRPRRGHGRPTLHDVAGLAAVTRITVSRFLRSSHLVAPETAGRIRDAIAATGYVPNLHAGNLASGRSKVVAALIPTVANSIFAETIQALSEGLSNTGYELLLTSTSYDLEREEAQLRALVGWAPAAIVVTGRQHSARTLKMLAQARASGTPVVEMWDERPADEPQTDFACIGFSHSAVGKAMAQHLLVRGHRSVAYAYSAVGSDFRAHERGEAFAAEIEASGAQLTILHASSMDPFDAGKQMLMPLLTSVVPVSAAAFSNDNLACGVLLESQRCGIAVPQTLSLLGFGDFAFARQLNPSLSTVSPPHAEIGRATARAVLAALESGSAVRGISLPWALLERDSTRWKRTVD